MSGDGVRRSVGELVALVEGLKEARPCRPDHSAGHERRAVIGQKLGEEDACERRSFVKMAKGGTKVDLKAQDI